MAAERPADAHARAWALMVALAAVVVALDQAAKQLAVASIDRRDPIELGLGFELVNARNRGVAFGLLSGGETPVVLLTIGAVALVLAYFASAPLRPGSRVAVALVTGGALGNLADRVRDGAVIDFIDPPLWPAFNLADVAIVAGVVLLLLVISAPRQADG